MSNDVYILQKDLPIVKAGRKFERIDNFYYLEGNKQASCLHRDWVEYNSEWFKRPDEIHRYSLSDSIGRFEIMSPRKEVEVIFNGVKLLHNVNEQTINPPNQAIPKDKAKEVLFTTEDGVDIYDEQRYYVVITETGFGYEPYSVAWPGEGTLEGANYKNACKTFSTKEKAQEYIIINKPCLSANDIKWWLEKYFNYPNGINVSELTELVKQKINNNG